MTTGSTAFATTHRVIHRVHHYAAVAGTTTEPALAAGFTGAFEVVVDVRNHTYRGAASYEYHIESRLKAA